MTSAFLSIATRTTHIIFHSLSTRPSIHSLFYQLILHEAMMSIQAILLLVVLAISAVDRTLAGVATAYGGANQVNRTGKNACGFNPKSLGKTWNTYYAALNERDFNKAGRPCGKCATVKGSRGTVKVKIVDICPAKYCKSGHIDLSSPALKKATGYAWDKKPVTFKIGKC